MVQCPHCQEQVEPTRNGHCPKCDANLSVAMLPTATTENKVEPFQGFRTLIVASPFLLSLLAIIVIVGIERWRNPGDALLLILGTVFFMGAMMPYVQPIGAIALVGVGIWIMFTGSRRILIICAMIYMLLAALVIGSTVFYFQHCNPCP